MTVGNMSSCHIPLSVALLDIVLPNHVLLFGCGHSTLNMPTPLHLNFSQAQRLIIHYSFRRSPYTVLSMAI